jgi:D-alanyl-D-alanine carboxypeptidase (penicillin-binding protein 5/6)
LLLWVAACVVLLAAAFGGWAWARLSRTPPPATVEPSAGLAVQVSGTAPALSWPVGVQSAVAVPAVGYHAQSGPETPAPVASLTKIMTGYIVLHDHPLSALPTAAGAAAPADADGPSVTMTDADVGTFESDVGQDESNIEVHAGEILTERQLLMGTLIRSANNLATALAIWDAGSLPAFVAKMNATAAQLGMTQTHFVDASGFDPSSQSTPADLLKVAAAAMQLPAFAQTVDHTTVTLPIVGTLDSYTPWIGRAGVVGVKSGYESQAGGCDVLALVRQVGGHPVTVLAAATGRTGPAAIVSAGFAALGLATAASHALVPVTAVTAGEHVGTAADGHAATNITASGAVSVVAWPGQTVTVRLVPSHEVRPGAPARSAIGSVQASVGEQTVTVPATTAIKLPPLTLGQRLF